MALAAVYKYKQQCSPTLHAMNSNLSAFFLQGQGKVNHILTFYVNSCQWRYKHYDTLIAHTHTVSLLILFCGKSRGIYFIKNKGIYASKVGPAGHFNCSTSEHDVEIQYLEPKRKIKIIRVGVNGVATQTTWTSSCPDRYNVEDGVHRKKCLEMKVHWFLFNVINKIFLKEKQFIL